MTWLTTRAAALRFGPEFQASIRRDPYVGCGTVEDHGDYCVIGPLAGEMTTRDRDEILECCAAWGFGRALVERRGAQWEYDLTARPFRRVRK